jgi:hypothetical protein
LQRYIKRLACPLESAGGERDNAGKALTNGDPELNTLVGSGIYRNIMQTEKWTERFFTGLFSLTGYV